MKNQLIASQKAEIEFRKKLYLQQVEHETLFNNEFDAMGIQQVLKDRMKKTHDQMSLLQKIGIILSPYLEIGAERCQRSLVMENDFELNGGAAVDISFDMLKSCNYYRDVFKKAKSPIRICGDANNLPFMTSSIPFVFCYETLHHFPEPAPIVKEIGRVLRPGGYFFFDEEPYKQVLHLNLYKGKKIYSREFLTRSRLQRVRDRFFCAESCNEVEHGIVENDRVSLKTWKQALRSFDQKDVRLTPTSFFTSELFSPKSWCLHFAAYLLGGNISGICRKGGMYEIQNISILDTLICPSCRERGDDVLLSLRKSSFSCPDCYKVYPIIDEVLFLFSYDKFSELYPDIFKSFYKMKSE